MTSYSKREMIERIRTALTTSQFADWYNSGNFDQWISEDDDAPEDEVIDEDIARMFKL